MNLQERAMPNAFAGKRDFAPETKAPEHPHKSDCRFAETVCPRKTPPGAKLSVYQGIGHSPFFEDAPRFNAELAAFVRSAQKGN
jgi:pimeloyl-ACP methyl ester carboxylesterase